MTPHPYHKKIDRSCFEYGTIIPQEYVDDFLYGRPIEKGGNREICLVYKNKEYQAKLYHVNRSEGESVYQLRWDTDRAFLKALRKDFIHSYVILQSQKEAHESDVKKKRKFRGKVDSGNQEVVTIRPESFNKYVLKPFIQIETEWNHLFQRLAEANVFGWLFDKKKDKKYLISRSTGWYSVSEYPKHTEQVNVIYYLVNTKKKLLYIGKADVFGKRVRPGRNHQGMPGDWDKFRYDILKTEFADLIERVEDHTIRAFASVLRNQQGFDSLDVAGYTLVNKSWKKL